MAIITNPDWVPQEEADYDEGKPIRSEQGLALAGNPIAMGLGKPGAQRIHLGALPRLIVGSTIRTASIVASGASGVEGITNFAVIQGGEFRLVLNRSPSSTTSTVRRIRGGTTTVVAAASSTSPRTVDLTCVPGDVFQVASNNTTLSHSVDFTIRTDGGDLIPTEGLFGVVTGNAALL